MDLLFSEEAWEEYLNWQKINPKTLKKINERVKATLRDPYSGIGKPEPLKFDMSGCFSRRIDAEHRLVYKVENDKLIVIQCKYHY